MAEKVKAVGLAVRVCLAAKHSDARPTLMKAVATRICQDLSLGKSVFWCRERVGCSAFVMKILNGSSIFTVNVGERDCGTVFSHNQVC